MSMIKEFRKFVGFKILEYFILNPSKEIHLKELARRIKVSPASIKFYCDLFEREGILIVKRKGNLKIFKLNDSDFAVKEIKKAYYALLLKERGVEKVCKNCTLAIYGSFASGEFDEKSDLDIIVIGDEKDINYKLLHEIESKIGRNIQLTVIPFYKWEKLKKENDSFAKSVIKENILIKGAL